MSFAIFITRVAYFHQRYHRWLAMPPATPLVDLSKDKQSTLARQVRCKLKMLPDFDLREGRPENIVLIDEQPYMADYDRPRGDEWICTANAVGSNVTGIRRERDQPI